MVDGFHFNELPLKEYFQFGVSVDCVVFAYSEGEVKVLLIKRGAEPFQDMWAIPGDLVYINEPLQEAPKRILKELTGLTDIYMQQFQAFGGVDRHSDGRVITIAYYALMPLKQLNPSPASWASETAWFDIHSIGNLAFDHNEIYKKALTYLQETFRNSIHLGFELLPEKFTLLEFHKLLEYILQEPIDKANFRKKLLSSKLIEALPEIQENVSHRPAKLFRRRKIRKIEEEII